MRRKKSILEAIDKRMQVIEGVGWDKGIWNSCQGIKELSLEKLKSVSKDQFPNTLLIDNIDMGLTHSDGDALWVSLIDFAAFIRMSRDE